MSQLSETNHTTPLNLNIIMLELQSIKDQMNYISAHPIHTWYCWLSSSLQDGPHSSTLPCTMTLPPFLPPPHAQHIPTDKMPILVGNVLSCPRHFQLRCHWCTTILTTNGHQHQLVGGHNHAQGEHGFGIGQCRRGCGHSNIWMIRWLSSSFCMLPIINII